MAKSQAELEQPVKYYQLEAVSVQLGQVNQKLETIVSQTSGLATQAQVTALEKITEKNLEEAIKDINNEFRPKFRNTSWLVRIIIAQAVVLLFGIIGFLMMRGL